MRGADFGTQKESKGVNLSRREQTNTAAALFFDICDTVCIVYSLFNLEVLNGTRGEIKKLRTRNEQWIFDSSFFPLLFFGAFFFFFLPILDYFFSIQAPKRRGTNVEDEEDATRSGNSPSV